MDERSQKVCQVVAEVLGRDLAEIALDANFMEDLGADSLEVAEIVMGLESAFDVAVPDDAPEYLKTVGDVVGWLETHAPA